MFIIVPILMMPAIWMMGRATQLWHLVTLTATVWLLGGMGLALLSILDSLSVRWQMSASLLTAPLVCNILWTLQTDAASQMPLHQFAWCDWSDRRR